MASDPPNPFVQVADWARANCLFIDGLYFRPTPNGVQFDPVWRHAGYLGSIVTGGTAAANEDKA